MAHLTKEQEQALAAKMNELFAVDASTPVNADSSVKTWWVSRANRVREKMLAIDRDQMRSAAQAVSKWVR